MFTSMGIEAAEQSWQSRCEAHLVERLGDGRIVGAVVDSPEAGGLACSGLAEVALRIPAPARAPGPRAYLSSFSTDPRWRRRGMARAVLALLLDELGKRGVSRVELHATADGLDLYRTFGFGPRPGGIEMSLDL